MANSSNFSLKPAICAFICSSFVCCTDAPSVLKCSCMKRTAVEHLGQLQYKRGQGVEFSERTYPGLHAPRKALEPWSPPHIVNSPLPQTQALTTDS